jgi:hypothetical protein
MTRAEIAMALIGALLCLVGVAAVIVRRWPAGRNNEDFWP